MYEYLEHLQLKSDFFLCRMCKRLSGFLTFMHRASYCNVYISRTTRCTNSYNVKVKGTAIPLQSWTGPEGPRRLRLPDFKTIGTRSWSGCQPYAPAAFTPLGSIPEYSFLLKAESIPVATVRPEGLYQWKIPVTPLGIEPATFRLVAHFLNQLRYGVPPSYIFKIT
jgi:hypothetical protein